MKPGDLVRLKGFGFKRQDDYIGLIVKVWVSPYNKHDKRVNVLWGPGIFGKGLLRQTLEVINDNR